MGLLCPKSSYYNIQLPMLLLTICLFIMCLYARAQQLETFAVTGKVISAASGVAIEGATVTNKRTRIHAFTDRLGDYRIPARPDDILTYSFVGYVTAEEEIAGRERITVALDSAENTLAEVEINAGYYTTTRRTSTGNISRVTAEEIGRQPVNSPLAALAGRMPGVRIEQLSGYAGSAYRVQIRGQNSLREDGNDPLYVINGVPFPSEPLTRLSGVTSLSNPLNSINQADIASIEILKDADATAIYGSRGANGVVLITTKQGSVKAGAVTVRANTGFSAVPRMMDLLNTRQYVAMRKEAFANDGVSPTTSSAPDLLLWDTTRYTDWQRELMGRIGRQTSLSASLSGTGSYLTYMIGTNYFRETSVHPGSLAFQRGSGNIALGYRSPNGNLRINSTVTYNLSDNALPTGTVSTNALLLPPNAPEPWLNGELNWANGTFDNPYAFLESEQAIKTNHFLGSAVLQYEIIPKLHLRVSGGYSHLSYRELELNPMHASNPFRTPNASHSTMFRTTEEYGMSVEPQLLYQQTLLGGQVDFLLGASFQENKRDGKGINASGFSSAALMEQFSNATQVTAHAIFSQYRYQAAFGRIVYNLLGTYLLNVTFRRDGSSRFGPGRQWGNFGAVGLGWLFSEYAYIKEYFPWLSLGKIRGSYGVTGNDQIGEYGYLDTYQSAGTYMTPGLRPTRLANPDYGWEVNRKSEIALETGFLKNRLSFSASYYRNRSSNQLIGYQLPMMTGFGSIQANFPATLQNTGFEFELQATNASSRNLSWVTSAHLTLPYDKLIAFPDIENSSYNRLVVGKSIHLVRNYLFTGVDPQTGTYVFADTDNSGNITTADQIIAERPVQLFGGLRQAITWKGLSLDVFLQYTRKTDRNHHVIFGMPGTQRNQPLDVVNRWQAEGDVAKLAKYSRGSSTAYSRYTISDGVFNDDRSFLRFRNAELSYRIPEALLHSWNIQTAQIHLQCQNALTITRFRGLDPESSTLPILRTIVAGITLTF